MDYCVNHNQLTTDRAQCEGRDVGFSDEGIGEYRASRRNDRLFIALIVALVAVGIVRCTARLAQDSQAQLTSILDPHEGGRGGIVSPRPQFIFDHEAASAPARTLNTSAPGAVGD